MKKAEPSCNLEAVLATAELDLRPSHQCDPARESRAILSLTEALSVSPHDFFKHLVKTALTLTGAGSTGISLLNEETKRFVWPAVAGELKSYLGDGTPSDFGPCGTVLDRKSALLFCNPERHFTYLTPISPPLNEVLLIPFYSNGKVVGTIWAVVHQQCRHFDAEDRRLLEALSTFAASAYRVLADCGALKELLEMRPSPPR